MKTRKHSLHHTSLFPSWKSRFLSHELKGKSIWICEWAWHTESVTVNQRWTGNSSRCGCTHREFPGISGRCDVSVPGRGGSGVCWKHPSLHLCAGTCSPGLEGEAARDPIIYDIIRAKPFSLLYEVYTQKLYLKSKIQFYFTLLSAGLKKIILKHVFIILAMLSS